jgi:hypothetical protein
MRRLKSFSGALVAAARARTILPALALLVLVLVFMEASPIGKAALRAASGGGSMLDMRLGYGQEEAYGLFDALGAGGRQLYSSLLCLDFVFALVYMFTQSLMLSSLMRRSGFPERFRALNLLPFARTCLDILENLLILGLLGACPARLPWLVAVSACVTVLKWILYGATIGLLFYLGFQTSRNGMKRKGALAQRRVLA